MIKGFEHYLLGEKLYQQIVSNVYKKYNITYMEFTIIMFLANNNYDTASDIVKYRCLTKSHVSVSIKSLQDKGLLIEQYLENDRRSKHLKLTSLTEPIIKDGRIAQKKFIETLYNGLTNEDIAKIKFIHEKINNNIKDNLIDYRRDNE